MKVKLLIITFLSSCFLHAQPALEVHVPDLSPEYQKALMEIWSQNQSHHIRVDIMPGQPFKVEITQQVSMMSRMFNSAKKAGGTLVSSKDMLFWLI